MSAHEDVDLGHTFAGWVGTCLSVIGWTVLGAAVVTVSLPLALLGAGVTVLAALATWALHLAGWGKPGGPRPQSQWDWRVRDRTARRGHPGCLGCRMAGRRWETGRAPVTTAPAAHLRTADDVGVRPHDM
ncbi:HGxxPAAW family protein [Streptomyces sp. LN785]|uniref:HGxxPAAW family protein n=1 Tax=Streptomyces sp. LN785 TaxID=3112983 RepID=UPI00371BAAC3